MSQVITLRIILEKPIAGVLYGVQKGKGTQYETVQQQLAGTDNLYFEFDVPVKVSKQDDLIVTGPFAQGAPQERFFYIGIGSYAGQEGSSFNGRVKVPLAGISKDLYTGPEKRTILSAKVPGRAKNGGPYYATVKPFDGWTPIEISTV